MEWFPECRDGGLDRYFYEQLQALAETGIVSGRAVVSACSPTNLNGIMVRPMADNGASLLRRWQGTRVQAQEAFRQGIDLVNAHFALYAWAYLGCIPDSVPLIVNFQGPWADEIRAESKSLKRRAVAMMARAIERRVYRRADRIITLSAAFRELVCERYGVSRERVRVVPGALHLDRYLQAPPRAEARKGMGLPNDRPVIVSVRRLARRMGLELLIEAIDQVRREHPRVLLLIGGKGALRAELDQRIGELNLQENVRMLGFVREEDLPTLYAAADFSVVPTVALEGFGLITAESLASGTPVLGTPVGATPEILEPLNPDLLFASATADAMAAKIKAVLRGDVTLPGSVECRKYVQRYGWPSVVPQLLAIYEEAIAEKKERG